MEVGGPSLFFRDSMSQTHPVFSGLSSTAGLRIFTWSSHSSCWKGRLSQKTSVSICCLVTRVEWTPAIDGLLLLNRGWQTHPVLPGLSSSVGVRIGTLAGKVVPLSGEAMNWHIFDVDSATAYAPCQTAVSVWSSLASSAAAWSPERRGHPRPMVCLS